MNQGLSSYVNHIPFYNPIPYVFSKQSVVISLLLSTVSTVSTVPHQLTLDDARISLNLMDKSRNHGFQFITQ